MLRTHTCGQLNKDDIGKQVTLCGWVNTRRDHGKLIFIDIRDRWGLTQAVFNPKEFPDSYQTAKELRSEYVICVTGEVRARPAGTQNPNLATGEVELAVKLLIVLSASETPPFEIGDPNAVEPSEDVRLEYRYLDIRRPKVFNKIYLRHRVIKIMRDFLDREGFIEVETPVLTKSTPEGARDFLVPSRLSQGMFYALPQSPQLFKQLLMVAGVERYFQVARCFRDEDLRSDRQPEFTQLDIEMSFVNEEDIFSIIERLMQEVFEKTIGVKLTLPFPRLTYKEAMERFGTDKPDLRKVEGGMCKVEGDTSHLAPRILNDFCFLWVTDFPLFKYNQEEKRWESEHHPFTAPREEDIPLIDKEPVKVRSRAYDLVVNGIEIGSGSIRIHNSQLQQKIFRVIGLSQDESKKRFGFLLDAFLYGAPPHGGIAPGIDRLIALLSGVDSIREVIAFPKTQSGVCPMTGAPSEVDVRQLKELGLKICK